MADEVPRNGRKSQRKPRIAPPKVASERVASTIAAAVAAGLITGDKTVQLSGRVNGKLLAAAQAQSALDGDDLLEYALAKVALEDDFAEQLLSLKGSIDPDVDLGI